MADVKKGNKGKNGTKKYGRNKEKCAAYAAAHHIKAGKKRFSDSKEHRNCGPLGYYTREKLGYHQFPAAIE
jgi:hypothetical protein